MAFKIAFLPGQPNAFVCTYQVRTATCGSSTCAYLPPQAAARRRSTASQHTRTPAHPHTRTPAHSHTTRTLAHADTLTHYTRYQANTLHTLSRSIRSALVCSPRALPSTPGSRRSSPWVGSSTQTQDLLYSYATYVALGAEPDPLIRLLDMRGGSGGAALTSAGGGAGGALTLTLTP
eukprot:scaffold79942_cov53-Phaeocystis_antarctica.AAC.2